MSEKKIGFFDFLTALGADSGLDSYQKLVLVFLAKRAFRKGSVLYTWTGKVPQATLAVECGVERKKILSVLGHLTLSGYILRKSEKVRTAHDYCLTGLFYVKYLECLLKDGFAIEKGILLLSACKTYGDPDLTRNRQLLVEQLQGQQLVPDKDIDLDLSGTIASTSQEHIKENKELLRGEEKVTARARVDGFSFFLRDLQQAYSYHVAKGLNVDPWPNILPRATENILESAWMEQPDLRYWFRYFGDLKAICADYGIPIKFYNVFKKRAEYLSRKK